MYLLLFGCICSSLCIATYRCNQPFINHNRRCKMILCLFNIERFKPCGVFVSLHSHINWCCIITSMCTSANVVSHVTVSRISWGNLQGLGSPEACIWCFNDCLQQKVGEKACSMSLKSVSSGYAASMLTESAQVDSPSTRQLWTPSINIKAQYPALSDYNSMNSPCISSIALVEQGIHLLLLSHIISTCITF